MSLEDQIEKEMFSFESQRKDFKSGLTGLSLDASKATPEIAELVREQLYKQIKGYLHVEENVLPQALLSMYIPNFRDLSRLIDAAREGEGKINMDKLAESLTDEVGNTAARLVLQSLSQYNPQTDGQKIAKKLLGDLTGTGYSQEQATALVGKLKTPEDVQDVASRSFRARMAYVRGVKDVFDGYNL